jgi:hypothetical protein
MRRKSKPIPKSNHNDDKKVGEVAKKAGLQEIPAMDEANIIMNDGSVIQFANPKVRGSMPANAFVLHGSTVQTNINKLTPDMRGEFAAQNPGGAGGFGGMNPQLQQLLMKLQNAMSSSGLSDKDLQDPSKQSVVQEALLKAGLTPEEMGMLTGMVGGAGADSEAAGAGAAAGGDEDMPELSGGNFEDVSDAD